MSFNGYNGVVVATGGFVHLPAKRIFYGLRFGLASTLPVFLQRSIHRIVVDTPRLRMRAASRALSPDSTSSTAHPQVLGVSLRHRMPPPLPLETSESDLRVRGNPL
jgi:hypothetical protein